MFIFPTIGAWIMDFAKYLTDEKAEAEGVWQSLGDGARARIARLSNENFRKAFRARSKANRAILDQDDETSDELTERIVLELMSHHILKDLEGVDIPDHPMFSEAVRGKQIGRDVAYTPKIGLELLTKSKDFAMKIRSYADAQESFLLEIEDEAVGNSSDG